LVEIPRLGERGGGWVVLQFALMAAIIVAGIFVRPPWPVGSWVFPIGVLVALAGVAIAVSAGRAHKGGVTPFPQPRPGAQLVESGPYHVVRHPIYSGGTLFFAGVSLTLSPAALVVTGVLAIVWALKAEVEEGFLRAANPSYDAYCERTRWRLIPYVY
jgi:protein-S-isoprenylcysteine O-methyltransferase Ste14